jgi:hypothetical protein
MKRIFYALLCLLMYAHTSRAQDFAVAGCSGTLGTTIYAISSSTTANATSRLAAIYPASQVGTLGGQTINAVYLNRFTSTGSITAGSATLKIYLKAVSNTDWGSGALPWTDATNGATLVYSGDPSTVFGSTSGWKKFALSSNFSYPAGQNLAVLLEYAQTTAATATISWIYEYTSPCVNTSNSNTTKYINNSTGTPGTSLSSTDYRRPYVGFDIVTTCSRPASSSVSNLTGNGATISWTAPAAGTPSSYELYTSNSATAPDANSNPTQTGITGTSYNLSNLAPSSSFYVWVRSNCGSANGNSIWTGPVTFRTATAIPWSEPFTTTATPDDWSISGWTIGSTRGVTGNPGNNIYKNLYSSATTGTFTSANIGPLTGNVQQLSFDYKLSNYSSPYGTPSNWGYFCVYIATNNSTTYTRIDSIYGAVPTGWVKKAYSLASFSNQTVRVRIVAGWTSGDYDLAFDNFLIDNVPSCVQPGALSIATINESSAGLNWIPPGSGTPSSYELFVSNTATPAPDASTGPSNTGITGTTYNLANLSPSTTYYVWVRSNCGSANGTSAWTGPATFTTTCSAVTDFTENFDGVTAPALPQCFTKTGTVSTQTTGNNSAPNCLYIYSTSTTSQSVVSLPPVSNLADNTHWLRFKLRGNSSIGDTLQVGYLTNPSDVTSFVVLQQIRAAALTYNEYTVRPGALQSSIKVLAFRAKGNPGYSMLIDDVSWETLPTCFPPTSLATTIVATDYAGLTWTAPATGTPAGYELYVSNIATPAPDANTGPSNTGITGTNYNLGGLSPATNYYVWIRSNCGSANGTSSWTGPVAFKTAATPAPIAWSEPFATTTTPDDWTITGWTIGSTRGVAGNPGNNIYKNLYSSATTGTFTTINVGPLTGNVQQLSFDYKLSNYATPYGAPAATWGYFNVYISTNYGATYTRLDSVYGAPTTGWVSKAYSLANYANQVVKIKIVANWGTGDYDLAFDNFLIDNIPTCFPPTALATTTIGSDNAGLTWTAPATGTPASYELYVSNTATPAPDANTGPSNTGITGTSYNLSGLSPATPYYVWVRSNCGSTNGTSTWSSLTSFTTLCTSVTDFTENFDGVTVPALPQCFAKVGTTGSVTTQTSNNSSAPNCLYIYATSQTNQAVLALPPVSNLINDSHWLRFKLRANSSIGDTLQVGYLTNASDPASFVVLQQIRAASLTYSEYTVRPGVLQAANAVLAFRAKGNPGNSMLIDDLAWEALPVCFPPTAPVTTGVTGSSAGLSWTAPATGTPASYELYVSNTATPAPDAGTGPSNTGITGTTYNLGGLSPATSYYVWVRSNCGGSNGTSSWTGPVAFTTPCAAVTDFTENFDGVTAPALPQCFVKVGSLGSANTQSSTSSSTPNCLYIYAVSQTTQPVVSLPPVSNLAANDHWLRFKLRANFTAGDTLQVGYLTNPADAASFVVLQQIRAAALTYTEYTVAPGALPASVQVLAFRAKGNPGYSLLIDDVSWEAMPSCLPPTGFASTGVSATGSGLSWTAPVAGTPSGYELYVSTSATPVPDANSTPSNTGITGTSYNLGGLASATTYYVWIRSNCGGTNGNSSWTGPVSFTTTCPTAPLPIVEGFNASTLPACWSKAVVAVQTGTKINIVATGDYPSTTPFEGTNYVQFSSFSSANGTAGSEERLIAPVVATTGKTNLKVQFYWYNENSTDYNSGAYLNEGVQVQYSLDGINWTNAGSFVPRLDLSLASGTGQWALKTISLPAAAENVATLYVAFKFHSEYGNNCYMDAVNIFSDQSTPVSIVSFKGQRINRINQLNWVTANEVNNAGFELQRSANGTDFSAIGSIASKALNGNSTTQLAYNFDDVRPLAGTGYYRLKQTDKDGKVSFSGIVTLKGEKATAVQLNLVYPNPVHSVLNLSVVTPAAKKVTIVVTDVAGKTVVNTVKQLAEGDNTLQLPVAQLANGTYLLKVLCSDGCETTTAKFIKQ